MDLQKKDIIQTMETECASLKKVIDNLFENCKLHRELNDKLQQENRDLEEATSRSCKRNEKFMQQIDGLEKKASNLQHLYEHSQQDVKLLRWDNNRLRQNTELLEKDAEGLKRENERLNTDGGNLRDETNSVEASHLLDEVSRATRPATLVIHETTSLEHDETKGDIKSPESPNCASNEIEVVPAEPLPQELSSSPVTNNKQTLEITAKMLPTAPLAEKVHMRRPTHDHATKSAQVSEVSACPPSLQSSSTQTEDPPTEHLKRETHDMDDQKVPASQDINIQNSHHERSFLNSFLSSLQELDLLDLCLSAVLACFLCSFIIAA